LAPDAQGVRRRAGLRRVVSPVAEFSAVNEDAVESMTDAAAPRRHAPRINA
jgi:hypothetical protein